MPDNITYPPGYQLKGQKVDNLSTKVQNFHMRQIKNAAPATDPNDYVILSQLQDHATTITKQVSTIINNVMGSGSGSTGVAVAGDLGGTEADPLVVGLQGIPVSNTAPTAGQSLVYNSADGMWEPESISGGTGGSQTPWLSNIDANHYPLNNIRNINSDFTLTLNSLSILNLAAGGTNRLQIGSDGRVTINANSTGSDYNLTTWGSLKVGNAAETGGFNIYYYRDLAVLEAYDDTDGKYAGTTLDVGGFVLHSYGGYDWYADPTTDGMILLDVMGSTAAAYFQVAVIGNNVITCKPNPVSLVQCFTGFNNQTSPAYSVDIICDCNVTGVYRINGVPISTGGSVNWMNETPSGSMNSTNVTFTLSHAPVSNSLHLQINGVEQIGSVDYTISGTSITMTAAPKATDYMIAKYSY